MKFYVPKNIDTRSYKYIVPSSTGAYYDLYPTNIIEPGVLVTYYRFYNNLDQDLYSIHYRSVNGPGSISLNTAILIEPTHDYTARRDYPDIVCTSAVLIIGFVVLFNIITSLIKKGGLFSGLF